MIVDRPPFDLWDLLARTDRANLQQWRGLPVILETVFNKASRSTKPLLPSVNNVPYNKPRYGESRLTLGLGLDAVGLVDFEDLAFWALDLVFFMGGVLALPIHYLKQKMSYLRTTPLPSHGQWDDRFHHQTTSRWRFDLA